MAQIEAGQIAGWIERARERMSVCGLTYDDLAGPLGISTRGGVSHYLNGRRELSAAQAVALAEMLRCPLDWLLTGKQVQPSPARISASSKLASPEELSRMIEQLSPEMYAAIERLISELTATKAPMSSRKREPTGK